MQGNQSGQISASMLEKQIAETPTKERLYKGCKLGMQAVVPISSGALVP